MLAFRLDGVPILMRQEQSRRAVAAVDHQMGMRHLHPAQIEQLIALPKLIVRPRPARPLNDDNCPRANPLRHPPPPRRKRHGEKMR